MSNLRERINGVLDIFNEYQIPEEKQDEIIKDGVNTTVSMLFGDSIITKNYYFDCYEFALFILYMQQEWCDPFDLKFDANKFLSQENNVAMSQPLQLFKTGRDFANMNGKLFETEKVNSKVRKKR